MKKSIFTFLLIIPSLFLLFLVLILTKPISVYAQSGNFQPQPPYYATFYYMWYKNPNTDGVWDYWTDHGGNPPSTWFSHYIPDPYPNIFDPATELYSENNYEIFKWQMSKFAEAHQEVGIASWWGQGTREDFTFNNIINSFMGRVDNPYPNFRWAIYYEQEGFNDPSTSQIVSDLTYIKNKYETSPYMLKVNGKPVVFVYAGANDSPGTMTQRWHDANTALGNYYYIVLKVFNGYANDSNQPNAWHQYAPAVRSGGDGKDYYFVSPGFWLDDGSPIRLLRNLTEFETAVKNMVATNATWKLTETWNEWGEGTSVEPGEQVITNPANGKDQIDPNGTPFGNKYIDILNANIPTLPNGTGVTTITGKPGDVNSDGHVDIIDIGIIIDNYGKSPIPNPKTDVNSDGVVNIIDIGITIDNYGK